MKDGSETTGFKPPTGRHGNIQATYRNPASRRRNDISVTQFMIHELYERNNRPKLYASKPNKSSR